MDRPTRAQRHLIQIEEKAAWNEVPRQSATEVSQQQESLGDRALKKGDAFQAYVNYQAAKSPKAKAAASAAMAQQVTKAETLRKANDPMSAFALLVQVHKLTQLRSDQWSSEADALARTLWPRVEALAAKNHYLPGFGLAHWLAAPFPEAHWSKQKLHAFQLRAQTFHGKRGLLSKGPWGRFFHGRMAAQFGAAAPVVPATQNPISGLPKVGLNCDNDTRYTLPGAGGLPEYTITVEITTTCRRIGVQVPKTEYYWVEEQVPVYTSRIVAKTHETAGFTPGGGQSKKCVSTDSGGRCVTWATVQSSPKSNPSTYTEVTSEKVLSHYKTVRKQKARTTYSSQIASHRMGTIHLSDGLRGRSFRAAGDTNSGHVQSNAEDFKSAYEGLIGEQRQVLIAAARDEATIAKAVLGGANVGTTILKKRYGIDAEFLGRALTEVPPLPSPKTRAQTKAPKPQISAAMKAEASAIQSAKRAHDQARRAVEAEIDDFQDNYDEVYGGWGRERFVPKQAFAIGATLGSSPLAETEIYQSFDLHYYRKTHQDYYLIGGVGALGSEATTAGAGLALRAHLDEDTLDGGFVRLGFQGVVQVGQELEAPEAARPYHAFFGPIVSVDTPTAKNVLLGFEIAPNLLQLGGSGGPGGMNRTSSAGVRMRIPLPASFFLRIGGDYLLGAQDAWNWTLGLVWDEQLLAVPDIPRRWR